MKTIKLIMATMCLCMMMACATSGEKYDNNVKELDALITEMESQESISEDDWKKAEDALNELQTMTEEDLEDLTEEQAEEYGKLAGRMAKLAIKQGLDKVGNAFDQLNGFMKGLGSALGEDEEE